MSKVIYVCFRDKEITIETERKVRAICNELNADNISSRPPEIFSTNDTIFGVTNPNKMVEIRGQNLLLGYLFSERINWHIPCGNIPDGNFSLFRNDESILEAITDCMATKSLWYYFDEKKLIISTSQKSIIRFLGNFQFNKKVIPWILSTGALGPFLSWDSRIKFVPADGKIVLDKRKWKLKREAVPVVFNAKNKTWKYHENCLKKAIEETFSSLNLDFSKWAVTLSGGYDSRAVLLFIKKFAFSSKKIIKTVTWGKKKNLVQKKSDAYIAHLLSKEEGTDHAYFSTESAQVSTEKIIERFLQNGEGRIDHIGGYMDGFDLWRKMYESGLEGVIRGDEVFGYSKSISSLMVRQAIGLTLCSDFHNLEKYSYIKNLSQEIPTALQKKPQESFSLWRDRLYHSFRVPILMSSLSELKSSYLDQINPFLSKRIVMTIRNMPDEMRTDKKVFKKIVKPLDPGIPYAKAGSLSSFENLIEGETFEKVIAEELSSDYAKTIFPEEFLHQVKQNMKKNKKEDKQENKVLIINRIKKFLPRHLKIYLSGSKTKLFLNESIIGFRILIITKMHKNLSEPMEINR